MDRGWRLGVQVYATLGVLPPELGHPGCTLTLVRREGDGRRHLLQLWEPRPPERILDTLREEFLACFSQAEPMDPGACHLGFDEDKLWFLQELSGTPWPRLWAETDRAGRKELRLKLREEVAGSKVARLLWPEVIGVKPGRMLAPRILGVAKDASAALPPLAEAPELAGGRRLWAEAPDLADAARVPVRGRALELTYLKSLMFGLGAATPMERVVLLLGEGGLGHERLCDWTAAAAETEGIWVVSLDALPTEKAGAFLARLLQELITGLEADLYAAMPAVARILSRRMATFAFLRGGRRADFSERQVEVAEVDAALEAAAFAQARQPRLIQVRSLERAEPEVHDLLKALVTGSRLPWVLSSRGAGLKSCTTALRHHPEAAIVVLDRLGDTHLVEVLDDILGPHELPEALVAELCTACLGNVGLMLNYLEMAQVSGTLVRRDGRWACPQGLPPKVEMPEDLVQGILAGRLLRMNPATLALVRYLALADAPLAPATVGRALGLDEDSVEEALNAAISAKLALVRDGRAALSSGQVRDLALAKMPPNEIIRCSRLLLKVLEQEGGKPVLSVRLQSFALDPATALSQVIQAIADEFPGPLGARQILEQALTLDPKPAQKARLWEFLSDNWCLATEGDRMASAGSRGRSPYEFALEALESALEALGPAAGDVLEEQRARLYRKQALLAMRLRRFADSARALAEAGRLLADHPYHPEQLRLCLAVGRQHRLQGQGAKALEVLEEGLRLLGQKADGNPQDQADLLLELGRAQGMRNLSQGALASLHGCRRLSEHTGDRRRVVEALEALAEVHLRVGQTELGEACLVEAIAQARTLDDVELIASCHLSLGILRSCQQHLGPALAHLESSYRRYVILGDPAMAGQAQAWKARTLAALGDPMLAELLFLQASAVPMDALTPRERGDRAVLEAELAGFKSAWGEAARHFQAAANRFEEAGLAWRERMARLRCIQAQARGPATPEGLEAAWIRLEGLKGPVEASGSRWLELEWHRAHALLLCLSGPGEDVLSAALLAWGEVLAGARELRFPALVLEASVRSSEALRERGERLGARSRVQEAAVAFQELWSKLPEAFESCFLQRPDLQSFRTAADHAGLPFTLPDRGDPLADWSPTQTNLSMIPFSRVTP